MSRIPKILHYCFGLREDYGGKPWSLVHHVCLHSAITRLRPDEVRFYYEFEPTGDWWRLSRALVDPIRVTALREVFGNPLNHPAHRADVLRLEVLMAYGGVYLDADVFVHADFDDLLHHSVVLGEEGFGGSQGVANAVILAEPGAPFLARWYDEYRWFRSLGKDAYWAEHSVRVPSRLAKEAAPGEVEVLGHDAFYDPLWDKAGLRRLFKGRGALGRPADCRGHYANHLWESLAWGHLEDLTPGRARRRGSNFDLWCAPYLESLPEDYGATSFAGHVLGMNGSLAGMVGRLGSGARWRLRQALAHAML